MSLSKNGLKNFKRFRNVFLVKYYILLFFLCIFDLYSNHIIQLKDNINLLLYLKEDLNFTTKKQNFFLKTQEINATQIIFYLDCEAPTVDLLTDQKGNYTILKKEIYLYEYPIGQNEYLTKKKEKACYFYNRKNQILIETKKNQWPNDVFANSTLEASSDFSISFWFFPLTLNLKEQNLFYWNSFLEDSHKQLKIYLEQGNLKLKVRNLIFLKNRTIDIDQILIPRSQLEEKFSWKHVFLSFSISKNQISFFLNNKTQKIITLPKGIYLDFYNWNQPPIEIGKDYLGFIDEFYILNRSYDVPITFYNFSNFSLEPKSGRIQQTIHSYFSPILDLSKDTQKINLNLEYLIPKGTSLKIEYTTSEEIDPFKTLEINWNPLTLNPNSNSAKFSLERLQSLKRYIQFKITMIHDSEGNYTPRIKTFEIEKISFPTLINPKNLRIIQELSNENQICLEWERIPDEEIENSGGYKIHIGIREQEFDFVLDKHYQNAEWKVIKKNSTEFPLTEKEKIIFPNRKLYFEKLQRNHIRIILKKEDLIDYYNTFIKESSFSKNRIPIIFEKNHIYYFAVSAYKDYGYTRSELSNVVGYQF